MAVAGKDSNDVSSLIAKSSANDGAIVDLWADPTTHRLLVDNANTVGLTVGTTTITGGTSGRILYDNAGVLGELATTGSTNVVLSTSPTLVTPILGIPQSVTLTNGTGLPISTGLTGTGTGVLTALGVNVGTAGAFVVNGGALGTPSSGVATNLTGTASGLTAGNVTTNANLTGVITSVGNATSIASQTGTGTKFVVDTSPTLVTPILGVATATSLAIGGATIGTNGLAVTGHLLLEGVTSTGATGTGKLVFDGTPTLVTPVLGAATATSINGLTITSSTGTLTITNAKTLSVAKTLTLDGTDSTTMTFPSTSATIARTDAAQTFTGTQTFSQVITTNNAITASGNAATVPVTSKVNTVTNNSAATLTITLTTASAVDGQTAIVRILDASAVAQTITWVNTENSTVSAPTTSNGSTTLPLTVGFQYNANTSKWRCVASA